MPADQNITIYTIGHSNVPVEDLIQRLRRYEIQTLIDVRSAPYSKYAPQFNREALKQILEESHSITYRFAGEQLGGRPKDPTCYKQGIVPDGKANYLELVDYAEVAKRDWFRQAIDRLVMIASQQRAAIMCSEEDPLRCHRHHLIARALHGMGVQVLHIQQDALIDAEEDLNKPTQQSLFS
jgi:uncharacterized protein (DUF488 family)